LWPDFLKWQTTKTDRPPHGLEEIVTENYFNYFTEIEEHFRRARGTGLFLLSPMDWALIEAWKNGGIPLEAVLRGIDASFEKWRAKPAHARTQKVNSVAFCAQAIAVEAQAIANGGVQARKAAPPPFSREDVDEFLKRNAAALRKAGQEDLAQAMETLDLEALYADLEQLEQRLTAMEEKMIARLRASASEEALFETRRALDQQLKPYRSKMSAEQLAQLEKQFLERRLLEDAGLPRLSLFYL
jgi:hypothetical protein